MKTKVIFLLCVCFCMQGYGQKTQDKINCNKEISAGNFYSYPSPSGTLIAYPDGYKPFYISHIGRHGSRNHSSEKYYKKPLELLLKAKTENVLTSKGDSLLQKMKVIYDDAKDRYGDLTPRGVREHKGIAARMFQNYREVFETNNGVHPIVESRSTMVVRCVLSMSAFNESLKEQNPNLVMVREASERYLDYLFVRTGGRSQYKGAKAVCDSLKKAWLRPDRFLQSIIVSQDFVRKQIRTPYQTMYDFFMVASILQDVDYLPINMYDLFTLDELYALWKCVNCYCYLTMGPSKRFGDGMLDDARPLLKNIINTASDVINERHNVAATLRFGHDCSIIPLAALLEIEGASDRVDVADICEHWNVSEVSPMATNLQFIFFKNKANKVKVRILLNEKDARLPLQGAPYYDWLELKKFCENKY